MKDIIRINITHDNRKVFMDFHDKLGDYISDFIQNYDKLKEIETITTQYTEEE